MQGKYQTRSRYIAAKLKRLPLRALLRCSASWRPLRNPEPGYTIILGNYAPLSEILLANFRLLEQQDLTNARQIIVVTDRPKDQLKVPIEELALKAFPKLPLRFLYYNRVEQRVFSAIGWAWTYCWKSWCKAIAQTRTRYAIIHDMDAMLLRRDIFEERYRIINEGKHHYVGVGTYQGNGILHEDALVLTWEMIFDIEYIRARFEPLDLFNQICTLNGRTMDMDCFLWAQSRGGSRKVAPVNEDDMVHPSQVITQYTYLINESGYIPPRHNNLTIIPYFYLLAGMPQVLNDFRRDLEADGATGARLLGHHVDLSKIDTSHVDWLQKQSVRLEHAINGSVRKDVQDYFDALHRHVERRDARAQAATAPATATSMLPEPLQHAVRKQAQGARS